MRNSGAEYVESYRRKYGEPTNRQVASIVIMLVVFVATILAAIICAPVKTEPTPEQLRAFEAKRALVLEEAGMSDFYRFLQEENRQ